MAKAKISALDWGVWRYAAHPKVRRTLFMRRHCTPAAHRGEKTACYGAFNLALDSNKFKVVTFPSIH